MTDKKTNPKPLKISGTGPRKRYVHVADVGTHEIKANAAAPTSVITEYLEELHNPNIGEFLAGERALAKILHPDSWAICQEVDMSMDDRVKLHEAAFACLGSKD